MGLFTMTATRTTNTARSDNATRAVVCFEVLDYDSLTYVLVDNVRVQVVALIYKKVTITHSQNREYLISRSQSWPYVANNKLSYFPIYLDELDYAPAEDNYDYSGTRNVEYILCVLVGENKYTKSLGNVNIAVTGNYRMSGRNRELIEGGGESFSDPTFVQSSEFSPVCSGERLYGVSVNCGKDLVTYSYDLEQRSIAPLLGSGSDTPDNFEDYNDLWTKRSRMVGAMNYLGVSGDKEFLYEGTAEQTGFAAGGFPDKVLAVSYIGG